MDFFNQPRKRGVLHRMMLTLLKNLQRLRQGYNEEDDRPRASSGGSCLSLIKSCVTIGLINPNPLGEVFGATTLINRNGGSTDSPYLIESPKILFTLLNKPAYGKPLSIVSICALESSIGHNII